MCLEPVFVELAIKGGRHIATKGKKRHIQRVANQWVKTRTAWRKTTTTIYCKQRELEA